MNRLLALSLLLSLLGCKSEKSPEPAAREKQATPHADEAPHEELPEKVRLSTEVVAAAGIKTAKIELASLPTTLELTGEVAANPDATAQLSSPTAARIARIDFKEGDWVKAGQQLATLESAELARARAALLSANARATPLRLNAERLRRLMDKGLAAPQEVSAAEAEHQAAQAEADAARQVLTAFGASGAAESGAKLALKSPLDGFVLSRDGVVGQSVEANHVLAVIANFQKAQFLAKVFEKDLGRVRQDARVEVRLNAYPDEVLLGTVESIGRQLDPAARTVLARIALSDDRDLLKGGLFGTAKVVMDGTAGTKRPVIPLSAVSRIADETVVFIRQADGDFQVHKVKLGHSAGGRVEVLSGLEPDEEVVIDGVFTLKSAVLKSTFGEDE